MKWEKYIQEMLIGGVHVDIRSMRVQDETGSWRRFRVCSTDAQHDKFTKRPGISRLVRDKGGKLGVVIQPRGSGYVKIGKNAALQQVVFAPVGAISKKPREKLLKQVNCVIYESDGASEAYEE